MLVWTIMDIQNDIVAAQPFKLYTFTVLIYLKLITNTMSANQPTVTFVSILAKRHAGTPTAVQTSTI